MQNNDLIIKRY